MKGYDISLVAEGLTAYAIERQNGFGRWQPPDIPPWSEQRRFWTDAILQGMVRLEGAVPGPELMERFEQRLEEVHGCAAVETLSPAAQKELVRNLRCYVSALEATGDDRRRQVAVVKELFEDMATHPFWDSSANGVSLARDEAERALLRMTAQMPIRFTRVLLGGDAGPAWVSGFVSGAVIDSDAVKDTAVYKQAVQDYPEITDWPALCTVYVGRGLSSAMGTADASDFDLKIINRIGDRFLKEQGIRPMGTTQMHISTSENIRVLKVEPGRPPEEVTMPNTLKAFQAAVGGYIEAVGLDSGLCLICNEEGKLMGLPPNRHISGDTIAGTFLIVGEADGEFCSLSDEDAAYYAQQFAEPIPQYGDPGEPTQWEFHVV